MPKELGNETQSSTSKVNSENKKTKENNPRLMLNPQEALLHVMIWCEGTDMFVSLPRSGPLFILSESEDEMV